MTFPSKNPPGRTNTFHTDLLPSRAPGCRRKGLSSVLIGLEPGNDRLDWLQDAEYTFITSRLHTRNTGGGDDVDGVRNEDVL